jgi:hypothetical protein
MKKHPIAAVLIITFLILAVTACETSPGSELPHSSPIFSLEDRQGSAYAAAQATLTSGQNEIMDLSHQATSVSLNMEQAANASMQTTLDSNQRQLMEIQIRGTEVSQNMALAESLQRHIISQTQMVWDATASAQNQANTATQAVYIRGVMETAQAQELVHIQSTQTAQRNAARIAYSLTATPLAAIQASDARILAEDQRQAEWQTYVVRPLQVILSTLIILLLILAGAVAYIRLMPVIELRLRTIERGRFNPLLLVNREVIDLASPNQRLIRRGFRLLKHPQPPINKEIQIEIIDSTEQSIVNWITEAEQDMRFDGRL